MKREMQDIERPYGDHRHFNSETDIQFLKTRPDIEQHHPRCPSQGQK